MIPTHVNESVQAHYTHSDLGSLILAALEKSGKDLKRLTPEDLAPIDEFHIRGRAATLELAQAAGVDSTNVEFIDGCQVLRREPLQVFA